MKTVAMLTALIAVTAATSAYAGNPGSHTAGGPIQQGDYCWVNTDAKGYGFWDRCDTGSSFPRSVTERDQPNFAADFGGDGGGGGNGR